jgi:hypothetical protein
MVGDSGLVVGLMAKLCQNYGSLSDMLVMYNWLDRLDGGAHMQWRCTDLPIG